MLYIGIERHKEPDCPGKDAEAIKKLASIFSKEYLAKKNVKIVDGFIDHSCMLQSTADHLCAFIFESDLPAQALADVFKPLTLEVRPMIRWQGIESKLKQMKMS
jgi:hypothetical protein